jgi:hypothetical protein
MRPSALTTDIWELSGGNSRQNEKETKYARRLSFTLIAPIAQ